MANSDWLKERLKTLFSKCSNILALFRKRSDIVGLLMKYPYIVERVLENTNSLALTLTKETPLAECQEDIRKSIQECISQYEEKFNAIKGNLTKFSLADSIKNEKTIEVSLATYFWRTRFAYNNSLKENIDNETVNYWLCEAIISARRYIDLLGEVKKADKNSDKKILTPIEREKWNYFLRYVKKWRKHSIKSLKAKEQASMNSMEKTS